MVMPANLPEQRHGRQRRRGDALRRLAERLFLGIVMSLIALMVDRRLRRSFAAKK
jgi:hypothetical protein